MVILYILLWDLIRCKIIWSSDMVNVIINMPDLNKAVNVLDNTEGALGVFGFECKDRWLCSQGSLSVWIFYTSRRKCAQLGV